MGIDTLGIDPRSRLFANRFTGSTSPLDVGQTIERMVQKEELKSSPPPTKVHPMHNETTNIAIGKESHKKSYERRQRTGAKIRSAELYQQAELLDKLAEGLHRFTKEAKNLLQGDTIGVKANVRTNLISHLDKIFANLQAGNRLSAALTKENIVQRTSETSIEDRREGQDGSRRFIEKSNDFMEQDSAKKQSSVSAEKTKFAQIRSELIQTDQHDRWKHQQEIDIQESIERLKLKLAQQDDTGGRPISLSRSKELRKKNLSVLPVTEEGAPGLSMDGILKTMEQHREQLIKIEHELRSKAAQVVEHMIHALDQDAESSRTQPQTFLDEVLADISEIRKSIEEVKRSHQANLPGLPGLIDDENEKISPLQANQMSLQLVLQTAGNQIIRAHELLTPEAVSELLT